jgi:ferredoxin
MAKLSDRTPENAPGLYYVDSTCIDCDFCRSNVPDVFVRNDEIGMSVVQRQPLTRDEIALADEAVETCPSNSIGKDGPCLAE